jgi:hypothetical protein
VLLAYIHIYISPDSGEGLPWWSIPPLTVLGIALGYGLIYGALWLWGIPRRRRDHARREAVAAALAAHPIYNVASVVAATDALFARFWPAWSANQRATLEQLGTRSIVTDWERSLDGMKQKHRREQVEIRRRPRYQVIGTRIRPEENREFVTVRIRARLHAQIVLRSGRRRAFPGAWGLPWWRYDFCWTMTHADGTWRVSEIRRTAYAVQHGWDHELDVAGPAQPPAGQPAVSSR